MSYVDTGDDELDYGENELGDATAAGVSLGAPADDDDMAQEDEYEELYDDVNIGLLEAPAVATGDAYPTGDMDMVDQKSDARAAALTADLDTRTMEQTRLEATLAAATSNPSEAPTEIPKGMKIEIKEEIKDERGLSIAWSRQELTSRQLHKENGKDVVQGQQMQLFLSPTTKEQGSGYVNGARQGSYNTKTDLASGNGENLIGSSTAAALAQSGGHPGSSFTAASGVSRPTPRDLTYSVADNPSRQQMVNDRSAPQQQYSGDGSGMLFVGDLQWWTTDAELEAALSEYGRVKNLKFYEERVSGKSKGYCQVEFFDHASAVACKQGMNGRKFHGRPCIVALGNAKSIQQMAFQQEKKTQAQYQAQEQMSTRRSNNNTAGGTRGGSYQERDSGRGYGRARTSQGMGSKTGQGGGGRGRGSYMNKGMGGGAAGGGGGGSGGSGMPYGQAHSGPMGGHQSAMIMHQGMIGQGYDQPYGPMGGRGGAAYGGYVMPGPPFPGMVAPFPGMGPGGLPGVAPHVNPAFFGRPNGMGLMPGSGMEGPHQAIWGDGSMVGWGGEEHDRRARDGSYAEDGGSLEYNYTSDLGHERSRTGAGWDKENGGINERHRRDDRDGDWERDLYKERERDVYRDQRDRDRYRDKDDDWDRERIIKNRSRSQNFCKLVFRVQPGTDGVDTAFVRAYRLLKRCFDGPVTTALVAVDELLQAKSVKA
ncbi:hypothetical protein GOP47_0022904 [Adiantum capillus-veneris]|uniref:RRM domain-containing protein n=1 Tax=Adiantum capillus-veneris TaxID=13818 RepID=A0A9D4Z5Z3_ADICA|nr:hypothetical protein GOP47_0022904 [Adiantum capillus-veneris]